MGDSEELDNLAQELIKEFEDYTRKAEINLHYTAQKGNPHDAFALLNLIINESNLESEIFINFKERIKAAIEKYKISGF